MNVDVLLLLWSIPLVILSVALLGVRRYSAFNVARHVGGSLVVYGVLAIGLGVAMDPPILVLVGAIGGTLVGQAYEDERRRTAERRRSVGLGSGPTTVPAERG